MVRAATTDTPMIKVIDIHSSLTAATLFAGALPCRQEPGNAYVSDRTEALVGRRAG
jgi:hypothetical protein